MQSFLSSELIASGLGAESYNFIKKVTGAKSKAEEHSHVTSELENLVAKMGLPDLSSARMKEYLIRLVHCFMLGYDIDFGIIYAIMATQSGETPMERRVGYLACSLFIVSNHELGIMLINSLQRDLKSSNYLDNCAALNAVCYLNYAEMQDNILDATQKAAKFPKQIVRKKAVVALLQLYKRTPAILDSVGETLKLALVDQDASVVFAALSVWKEIVNDHAERYQELQPTFLQIQRQIMEQRRITRSFMYHGVLAPWSQIICLQILRIYQKHGIGQGEELYKLVLECLSNIEQKVDAAYAIKLECFKLLASIDKPLLDNQISTENNPFLALEVFLLSKNHNMQYLGLIGLEHIDKCFWSDSWSSGSLIGKIISSGIGDETLMKKALVILDSFVNSHVLQEISKEIPSALSDNQSTATTVNIVGTWFVDSLFRHCSVDPWFVQTVIKTLAEAGKNLDSDYMQNQCIRLKKILLDERDGTNLRELSVDCFVEALKRYSSDRYSYSLVQLSFRVLGENAYLSSKYSEVMVMEEIQKWICLIQDDYTQICGLQAIKHCILRSKKWLSALEGILNSFRISPIPEKQEISNNLLGMIADLSFEKVIQEPRVTRISSNAPISANPNRPYLSGRFMEDAGETRRYPRHTFSNVMDVHEYAKGAFGKSSGNLASSFSTVFSDATHESLPSISSSEHAVHHSHGMQNKGPRPAKAATQQDSLEKSMLKSLIELELQDEGGSAAANPKMTTERFGSLWLEYEEEQTVKMDSLACNTPVALAKLMENVWKLQIVEVIGQEFIAIKPSVDPMRPTILIHVMLTDTIQLTVRSSAQKEMDRFLLTLPRLE